MRPAVVGAGSARRRRGAALLLGLLLALGGAERALGDCAEATPRTASAAYDLGLVLSARGLAHLSQGSGERALACLDRAKALLPPSAVLERDRALALAALERWAEALAALEAAPGDDPEALALRALVLARLGRGDEGAAAAREGGRDGQLIAAALGDRPAALAAAPLSEEATARGALAALVLAASAGEQGETSGARVLLDLAISHAEHAGEPIILNTAKLLGQRLAAQEGPRGLLRLRAGLDHSTNPLYLSRPETERTGLRLALRLDAGLVASIGAVRVELAGRADQHAYLTSRDAFHELDVSAFVVAAGAELPLGPGPGGARVGVRARVSDVFGDGFGLHFATTIEGGPTLSLPLDARSRLELGFFGSATDVIDKSPADAKVSSLNRDQVGQRAMASLSFGGELIGGRADLVFLRDAALGEAFDALGGSAGARLWAAPGDGVVLGMGGTLTLRDFGPVGDQAIIGPAATRLEVRLALELSARVPLGAGLELLITDLWLRTNARAGHDYVDNILSLAVERSW